MQAYLYHFESNPTQALQWKTLLIKIGLPLDSWKFLLRKLAQIQENTQLHYRHIAK